MVGAAVVARGLRPPVSRSCVACRTSRDKRDLLRVVRAPDRTVALDPTGRASGRGAYVCRDTNCITTAFERGILARTLETPIPAGLAQELAGTLNNDTIGGGARGQE